MSICNVYDDKKPVLKRIRTKVSVYNVININDQEMVVYTAKPKTDFAKKRRLFAQRSLSSALYLRRIENACLVSSKELT